MTPCPVCDEPSPAPFLVRDPVPVHQNLLVRRDPGNSGIGFDASYVGPDIDVDGRVQFVRRFYDELSPDGRAGAVVCRHVIEHLPRPLSLLEGLRRRLSDSAAAAWNVRTAVLTNPHYVDENARLLQDLSLDVRLVDLMHPGEGDAHSH